MPKNEFDFEDPFELNGMGFVSHQDTTDDMAECFTEEFMRMGYNPKQVLALFRNPHYLGPHLTLEKRGEPFIRELITEVFARRGKVVTWPDATVTPPPHELLPHSACGHPPRSEQGTGKGEGASAGSGVQWANFSWEDSLPLEELREIRSPTISRDEILTDPMGSPIPKLDVRPPRPIHPSTWNQP